jgi:Arc/MetJ-type ribon-helix-helix transcriptional regulator
MSEKATVRSTSILLDDATKALLNERDPVPRAGDGVPTMARALGNRSEIIREAVRRYDEICRKELPALTMEEKRLLREAGRRGPPPGPTSFGILLDEVRRQGAEGEQLMMRILALSSAQQIALLDDVERYWAGKRREEALRAAHAASSSSRQRRRA